MKRIPNGLCALVMTTSLVTMAPVTSSYAAWSGGLEGGTVFRDGGNATRLRLKLQNPVRPWSHYLYVDWIRGGGGGNSYEAGYLPRYWFDNNFYTFGEASVRVDDPLSIDRQRQFVAGLGYQWRPLKNQFISVEAGAAHQRTEFRNAADVDDTLGLLRADFSQVLSNLLRLELDLDYTDGEALRQATAEASIAIRVPSGAIKFSYRTRRISPDNADTIEDSDSFVSFRYGF